MKKNKKVKENFDNVVINNVELTPTTIGKINENESGLKGVIILFGALILIIFGLPYAVNLVDKLQGKEVVPPPPVVANPEEPTEEPTPENPKKEEEEYLSIASPIAKTISGIKYEITVDTSTKKINVKVTNVSGSPTSLISNPMYIELYTEEKTLLDRVMISKEEIVSDAVKEFTYTFKDNTGNNVNPVYLTLNTKSINDYPAITLTSQDINNSPYLTCTKDNETLVYTFQNSDNEYLLSKISDRILVTSNDEETINTYEALTVSYNSIDGVDANVVPKTNGFSLETEIDLSKVKISEKKRILNNQAFYEKDELAKTIYFELNSSGFKCQ